MNPIAMKNSFCTLLALSALLLVACGGSSSNGSASTPVPNAPTTPSTAQLAASKPGELLSYVKGKIAAAGAASVFPAVFGVSAASVNVATASPVAASSAVASDGTAFSGTTNQEQGVEEIDIVKTDGRSLFALRPAYYDYSSNAYTQVGARLVAAERLADASLSAPVTSTLSLTSTAQIQGMFLSNASSSSAARLAIIASNYSLINATTSLSAAGNASSTSLPYGYSGYSKPQVQLDVMNASTSTPMAWSQRLSIDGSLVGSRQIGNMLYLVTRHSPYLPQLYTSTSNGSVLNQQQLNSLIVADLLPNITVSEPNGASSTSALYADTDCYVQSANSSPVIELTSITAIDLGSANLARSSSCFLGGSDGLYVSPSNIYLSSSRFYSYPGTGNALIMPTGISTDIHKFSLNGASIRYAASGEVPGHLGWDREKLSYRMSEYQGDLRVISYTGSTGWVGAQTSASTTVTASPATLSVLRETAGSSTTVLSVISSLPNSQRPAALGKAGEQIYAVRFLGGRAYVVTFRRTDPLYVLDLSNPLDPKTVGELLIPGFSDYLYPMGSQYLLGIGKEAIDSGFVSGVKIALFNVAQPSNPSLVTQTVIGGTGSMSGLDFSPHGINIMPTATGNASKVVLPVRVHDRSSSSLYTQPISQGFYRFEVDHNTGIMQSKSALDPLIFSNTNIYSAYGHNDLSQCRSPQIGSQVFTWCANRFAAHAW